MIKKAISYISKNFSGNLTLEEVAEQVHLNPAYFSSIFKQSTGSSFKEYLNMIRIEESKRLLANTDYSIIDIAIASVLKTRVISPVFSKNTQGLHHGNTGSSTGIALFVISFENKKKY